MRATSGAYDGRRRVEGRSEEAASETHPQTAVAPEVVALINGVLLRAPVNNAPMPLALEIFLPFYGPAELRQSFERGGVLGKELGPCQLGPVQAGHVGFQTLLVGLQRILVGFTEHPPGLERLVEGLAGFPHLPLSLVRAPQA